MSYSSDESHFTSESGFSSDHRKVIPLWKKIHPRRRDRDEVRYPISRVVKNEHECIEILAMFWKLPAVVYNIGKENQYTVPTNIFMFDFQPL